MKLPFLYFDPGTGALIVQLVAAGAASVLLFYKRISVKVKSFFGKKEEQDLMGNIDIEDNKTDDGDNK